jgi:hypothetical protein
MSVPYDKNADIIVATLNMTDGTTLAQLPGSGVTAECDTVGCNAWVHNAGLREIAVARTVPGPISTNVTVTVNGVASLPFPVLFDGPPVVTLESVTLAHNRYGDL